MRCYVDPDKISAQPDDDETVEQVESDARNHEQVHGSDLRRVVAKEGKPSLRRGGGSKTVSVPPHQGLGLDDPKRIQHGGKPTIEPNEE